VYSNTTRAWITSCGGDGSTRAKEDAVELDVDFLLVLDMVDALDDRLEPPVMRLDPEQVAGIYKTGYSFAIRGFLCIWSSP